MKLIEPTMEYDRQIQRYRQEFLEYDGSMDGCGSLRRFDQTQDWLDQVQLFKCAETTPPHSVPMTQYIYLRETDNKIVGVMQIRHDCNTFLAQYGGHIGYSVCPQGNEGSRRVILHNGGKYESTVHDPERDQDLERYWIDLSDNV